MIWSAMNMEQLPEILGASGLGSAVEREGTALIKVNLSSPPRPGAPRSDTSLIREVVDYVLRNGAAACAIVESANGYLHQNLESIGLGALIRKGDVMVIDLDLQETDCVTVDGECHYLPRCLKDYAVRIGIPATSKRRNLIFSNNVKLFVGAVPRRMYQVGVPGYGRPRVHIDLHTSVANIYRATMLYAPFHFFVNGGNAIVEGLGETHLDDILVGNDALELDRYLLTRLGIEQPNYIEMLGGLRGATEMIQGDPGTKLEEEGQA